MPALRRHGFEALRVRHAESGHELVSLSEHTDEVTDGAWSSDGTRIATASHDGTIKIWRVG